jgi:hypothetical protein
MRDVPLCVAPCRLQTIDTQRNGRGEPGRLEVSTAKHARVGERVEICAGLFDDPLERFGLTLRITDRAIDPDLVHSGADFAGELGVDDSGLAECLFFIGADEPVAAVLVANRCAQPLPPATLSVAFAGPHAD